MLGKNGQLKYKAWFTREHKRNIRTIQKVKERNEVFLSILSLCLRRLCEPGLKFRSPYSHTARRDKTVCLRPYQNKNRMLFIRGFIRSI